MVLDYCRHISRALLAVEIGRRCLRDDGGYLAASLDGYGRIQQFTYEICLLREWHIEVLYALTLCNYSVNDCITILKLKDTILKSSTSE